MTNILIFLVNARLISNIFSKQFQKGTSNTIISGSWYLKILAFISCLVHHETIFLIGKHNGRFKSLSLFRTHLSIGNQYHDISDLDTTSGWTIETACTSPAFTSDGVGLDPFPIIDIDNLDFFADHDIGRV